MEPPVLQTKRQNPVVFRKVIGIIFLLGTIGVTSCQAFLAV